jgi:hypothetical protein
MSIPPFPSKFIEQAELLENLENMVLHPQLKKLVQEKLIPLYHDSKKATAHRIHDELVKISGVDPLQIATIYHRLVHRGVSNNGVFLNEFAHSMPQSISFEDWGATERFCEMILEGADYAQIQRFLENGSLFLKMRFESFLEGSNQKFPLQYSIYTFQILANGLSLTRQEEIKNRLFKHPKFLDTFQKLNKEEMDLFLKSIHSYPKVKEYLMQLKSHAFSTDPLEELPPLERTRSTDYQPMGSFRPISKSPTPFSPLSQSETPFLPSGGEKKYEDLYGGTIFYPLAKIHLNQRFKDHERYEEVNSLIKSLKQGDEIFVRDLEAGLKNLKFSDDLIGEIFDLLFRPNR